MSDSKKLNIGQARRKELDDIIRKAAQAAGTAVESALDKRHTYKDEGEVRWQAYERYLLSNGHTLFINLVSKAASVSKQPDKFAQAKVEKRAAKLAKRAERKAAREAKAAKSQPVTVSAAKPEPKPKATTKGKAAKVPVVKFDSTIPTVELSQVKQAAKKQPRFVQPAANV